MTERRSSVALAWVLVACGSDGLASHDEVIEAAAAARGAEMVELLESSYGYVVAQDLHPAEDPRGEHDETSWGRRFPDVMVALLGSR